MPATSIYGTAKRKITYKRRILKWSIHRKGPKAGQRWYKSRRGKKITRTTHRLISTRFTFYGETKWINKAKQIMEKQGLIPKKQYEDQLDAKRFCKDKEYRDKVTQRGKWIDWEELDSP